MSVFEQLRPFVSFFQACGLIPYTIKQHSISNKFKFLRFTFSFKHLIFWWFLTIFLLQLLTNAFMAYLSKSMLDKMVNDKNIPITLTIMSGVSMFSYTGQLLLSRWIFLHYGKLRKAVEAIQQVERLFGEKFIKQHKSSLGNRFIIGFTLIVTTVIFNKSFFPITWLYLRKKTHLF